MFKKQINNNIEYLDIQMSILMHELNSTDNKGDYNMILDKIDRLVEIRGNLTDSRERESIKPIVVSGLIQVIGIFSVLHYEKTDVVTSKAFSMVTKLFKGS